MSIFSYYTRAEVRTWLDELRLSSVDETYLHSLWMDSVTPASIETHAVDRNIRMTAGEIDNFSILVTYDPLDVWCDLDQRAKERIEENNLNEKALIIAAQDDYMLEAVYASHFGYEHLAEKLNHLSENSVESTVKSELMIELNRIDRAFQISAAEEGVIFCASPFSGRLLESRHGFLIPSSKANQVYFAYHFFDEYPFFLFTGGFSGGKIFLYLPHIELVIRLEKQHHQWGDPSIAIAELKRNVLRSPKLTKAYLEKPTKPAVVTGVIGSLGHWLWNDLSAIATFNGSDVARSLGTVIVGPYEHFNAARMIATSPTAHIQPFENERELFNSTMNLEVFPFRLSCAHVTGEGVDLLRRYSAANVTAQTVEDVQEAQSTDFILWVNIRAHTKIWENQVVEITNVCSRLVGHPDISRVALFLDGTPDCIDIVRQIRAAVDSKVRVFDGTNIPALDTAYWSNYIDTYIATIGTGLIFTSWIATKEGVAHAEHAHLSQMIFWPEVRMDAPIPKVPSNHYISEIEPGKPYSNYLTEPNIIGDMLMTLIEEKKLIRKTGQENG